MNHLSFRVFIEHTCFTADGNAREAARERAPTNLKPGKRGQYAQLPNKVNGYFEGRSGVMVE